MSVESDSRNTFGSLIKKLRAEQGMSREEFARKVGVNRATIVRMEHGVVNPTRSELVRAIKMVHPDKQYENKLYNLLRIFSPRRRKRTKFHLPFSARVRRNGSCSNCNHCR